MVSVVFYILVGGKSDDDERQSNRWKGIVNRFEGKLVKMIKDVGSKFDDYSISPKIRQILLHWGLWINWKIFFISSENQFIKMSYCQFNRQKILKKQRINILKKKLLSII